MIVCIAVVEVVQLFDTKATPMLRYKMLNNLFVPFPRSSSFNHWTLSVI